MMPRLGRNRHERRQIVPSGEFIVRGAGEVILEAYLGTCVGVAVWDEQARVGGIYHALLGEPLVPGMESANPCRYAVSGLPVFVDALLAQGAQATNLKAAVAGGAIVEPGADVQLDLQIGSKTLERVTSFLESTDIPVVLAETGGTFTCALCLDCGSWKPHIRPIAAPCSDASASQPPSKLGEEDLLNLMEQLRPIPQTAFKILNLLRKEGADLSEVSREISRDQVLAARLLALCNTPLFSPSSKVTSLDRAVVLLGENRVLQIALTVILSSVFPSAPGGYSLCKGGLFQHAVGTALIAEHLAKTTGGSPASAYVNGLLHDIGKVVLDQAVAPHAPLFYRNTLQNDRPLVEVEREAFGIDHATAGSLFVRRWDLPDGILHAVSRHHDETFAQSQETDGAVLVLADFIANRFLGGLQLERPNLKPVASSLNTLDLNSDGLERIVDSLPLESIRRHATGF
ncbi:HDIG domain-containing protein [Desulfacinum hydrothermale DSM 13146]|uniref:Probable chemoreceptor glutamine deamidase CheD n=1 Tax=Desulfacinum hydrothermale DSM 13146 TaxID=1121390 RepID=A0A1W1WX25_9BACT|nr:HDOD domain-containing protein [Desulfacinum hydrothermale]SMC16279.1 HDIG domain-containing protein [Desulfacinum hydrothermale DSM 13146]